MTEEMMPLIETVPGAIRFHPDVFNDFFEKLEQQYQSVLPEKLKRLELLVRWLADQGSMEPALRKVRKLVLTRWVDRHLAVNVTAFGDCHDVVAGRHCRP